VTRERPGSPRTRLFVALELPEQARGSIAVWRDASLGGFDDLRPVRAEYLHMTLVFLGWQYERDIERIAATAFEPLAGLAPAELSARALVPVPKRGPRLFALDLEDPAGAASTVQEAAARALSAARFYEPEKRPFWPHVTLARVKRGRRAPRVEATDPPGERFEASVITLYRSVLQPQGARYEPLHSHTLG
jgi:RNA 2',3'-cyclic 3'-phosphodiesterase